MKVLIGSVIMESNTFSPMVSTMDDFRRHHWVTGEAIRSVKTENELRGFLQAAEEQGVETVPVLSANAVSSGTMTEESFHVLLAEVQRLFEAALSEAGTCDGIYLALHGAMVAQRADDPEGELVSLIRRVAGWDIPLVVSLDLHANVTRRLVRHVNGLVGFRTYPHVDFAETGRRSARLLFAAIRGDVQPYVAMRKLPLLVPAENSQSSHGPFAELWAEAQRGEASGDALITSLFPVQPWLDIEEMGCSVVVVGDVRRKEAAIREAERLADIFWRKREAFGIALHRVADIVDEVRRLPAGAGPIVVSDSADSPSAGSIGDSNAVLRGLVESGLWRTHSCLVTVVDAEAVAAAIRAGVGETVRVTVGYKATSGNPHPLGAPLAVEGRVRRIGDGRFSLKGGYAKNTECSMGRCVVLEVGKLSVLLTERATFSGDPSMYRSMGLEPAEAHLVLVKSATQFRGEYERISSRIYILDTPGYSSANLKRLAFAKLNRPVYPLDEPDDWRDHPVYGVERQRKEDEAGAASLG
ncbi:M81 family metallopeptidase [Paenibacillus sp. HJGM_3]|uniref:M81 family metallopeptidase n=1 Tax=Paenibacillus sp. HJGM_3 TaxID=3379816 RepID=UPI003858298B